MSQSLRVSSDEVARLAREALVSVGVPDADAEAAAEILVSADLQGIDTHGVRRLAPYVARIRDGVFNPKPEIRVVARTTAAAVVDGGDGLGPVVGMKGLRLAIELATEAGVGYVTCRNSHHFGALAAYARHAAAAGVVCLMGTTAFATMAPWGGAEVRVGNNPLGIAAPRRDAPPFILDIAMSIVARGKLRLAQERGEAIPPGWALDAHGNPTIDPLEGLKGFVLPIGGHKGYGLALAVDILAGVLAGGAVSPEVGSLFQQNRAPQRVGHFFVAIDPARLIGRDVYDQRMEEMCRTMTGVAPLDPARPVMLPGEIEARTFADRSADGIPLFLEELEALRSLAAGAAPDKIAAF